MVDLCPTEEFLVDRALVRMMFSKWLQVENAIFWQGVQGDGTGYNNHGESIMVTLTRKEKFLFSKICAGAVVGVTTRSGRPVKHPSKYKDYE